MVLIAVFAILLCINICLTIYYLVTKRKEDKQCTNFNDLKFAFLSSAEKFTYSKLNATNCHERVSLIFARRSPFLQIEKQLVQNKNYLLAISKFISYKIKTNKQKYRCKGNLILIEQIARVLSREILFSNDCKIFSNYKKLKTQFSIRQKEEKVFKTLLGNELLVLLCDLDEELGQIAMIIEKSKTVKKVHSYKKQVLKSAEIYGIKKFNPNSTKILIEYEKEINKHIFCLFEELKNAKEKLKIILTYLLVMFN